MKPLKQLVSIEERAIAPPSPTDLLLRRAVQAIASYFHVECLLWTSLEGEPGESRVYGSPGAGAMLHDVEVQPAGVEPAAPHPADCDADSDTEQPAQDEGAIACYVPRNFPAWLIDQLDAPRLTQLETGDLIVPILAQAFDVDGFTPETYSGTRGNLQLLLQVRRSPQDSILSDPAQDADLSSTAAIAPPLGDSADVNPLKGWTAHDVSLIKRLANELGLTYSSLLWREKFERSQRQIALMGRIAHLLNSGLETDDILQQIAAELGQGLMGDRCLVMRLQATGVAPVAHWERSQVVLPALEHLERSEVWQPVIDTFLDGGASYLTVRPDASSSSLQHWLQQMGATSALLIPILIQSDFFGAICLLDYFKVRWYALDEVQTVRQVGDHTAIALASAQHHHDSHRQTAALRLQVMVPQTPLRDSLTQLLNAEAFDQELQQLSRPALWTVQPPFSLIICDIDYFKLINETYGYSVGDQILSQLAQRLRRQLRQGTLAYRYGGEEFAIILPRTSLTAALDVAERLLNAIHGHPFDTSAGPVSVTVSFGVAQQDPRGDRNARSVLQRAEKALQDAKRQGRDCAKGLEFGLGA
ncbi:sensor domain-containing diguanylate cyclase [Thermoleptolyngbya sichuanensis A183]|uniref:Sensor domain-containing diguanylate cyclase n=1 Tax=Thermoleptolyngbya sichuanensis A183 TaxID=2737172 RepID=A0A6M8BDJ5_9CYAN|nr:MULTISPECIES: sensor domain-containing diguanylate cyclase [Thermoleptolyngbya]QKD82350.1 sensor domain-containing diguanylate cyclase [Thermoleptolyngbya sichuanensis A183]